MKPRRRWVSLTVLLVVLAGSTLHPASAAEAEKSPVEGPIGTVFRWLNFLLVFGAAGYFIAKRAPAVFRRRAEAVAVAIREAAEAKAQADQQLGEAEVKLARLDEEVAELRAGAQRESAAEAERIRALARREAEKIERAAQAEIEASEHAALVELKAIAARLAIERADALIRKRISATVQASLFRAFLSDLARSTR